MNRCPRLTSVRIFGKKIDHLGLSARLSGFSMEAWGQTAAKLRATFGLPPRGQTRAKGLWPQRFGQPRSGIGSQSIKFRGCRSSPSPNNAERISSRPKWSIRVVVERLAGPTSLIHAQPRSTPLNRAQPNTTTHATDHNRTRAWGCGWL